MSLPKPFDLDDVLKNELGQFGCFQLYNLILVSIPTLISAFLADFIFSTATIPHRCQIPECGETRKDNIFEPSWLAAAIPSVEYGFSSCERFVPTSDANGTLDTCPATYFTHETQNCDNYVYARTNSIVYDFDLGCQEWMRSMAGFLCNIGALLVLPIIGYISDRYGRKFALIFSVFNSSLLGLMRVFSVNYTMYLVLQLLQSTFGGGLYSSAYIIAAELVGPKYRVLMSAVISSTYSLSLMLLGGIAWLVQPWRYYILTLNIPGFFIIGLYWLLHESVRWLLSKRKFEEAKVLLEKIARMNGKQLSEKTIEALRNSSTYTEEFKVDVPQSLIWSVVRSRVLLRRVCTTPIWWVTTTLVYYGLSINAISLSDTIYLNFILVCAIEIPGSFLAVFLLDRIGRKATLCSGFLFSAVCNIAFIFIPHEMSSIRLLVYLSGKFGISMVFTSLYLFTSELYPTQFRHSLLAFSSMIGRIGSITAPLTPALMVYWDGIPSMLFGVMGLLSGVLVLTQPETLGTRIPDTLAEAEALGKPESKTNNTN